MCTRGFSYPLPIVPVFSIVSVLSMDFSFVSFATFLSILWFFVYWILGGVFFAVIAILRLGRVRKVRFSCLFSLWALVVAVLTAFKGLEYSEESISTCMVGAQTKAESVTAIFGCGAAGVFGSFLLGALTLTVGGFLIFAASRSKSKPWFVLESQGEEGVVFDADSQEGDKKSKFF